MALGLVDSLIIAAVDLLQSITLEQLTRCVVPRKWAHSMGENSVEAASSREDETSLSLHQGNEDSFFDLPNEIQDNVLATLEYKDVFQAKTMCKLFKAHIEGDGFYTCLHPREGLLTGLHFFVRDGVWQCAGWDLDTKDWKKLPRFAMLLGLDSKLFKDRSICGASWFMCVYLFAINEAIISSPVPSCEKMVVFHSLTLNHPRSPVFMHMVVSPAGDSFEDIVAGNARVVGNKHLSKITEVFDSRTSKWTVTKELPGPLFALNEHQTGAYKGGVVYYIVFLVKDRGRDLLAYSLEEGKWLSHLACPLPSTTNLSISQVENINGEIVVLSEIEHNLNNAHRTVESRIDVLEFVIHTNVGLGRMASWRNVLMESKFGSQAGLQIYPEYTCVPLGLFKEYSLLGYGGLMFADASKLSKKVRELVVFNPVTGKSKALPPLLHPRRPALVHISVNSAQRSYNVILAGSSSASDEHLSRKIEIFDSSTFQWKETSDLPGPTFGLNEHQADVCLISFLEGDRRRGVDAFDVEQEKWVENLECPIPFSSYSNTLQLVESDGKLYLFSEQERGQSVEHCIDELEFPNPNAEATSCQWRNVVRVRKSGGRGLLVYPEYTSVGFGEGKLLIFNALKRDGVVNDMRDGRQCEVLAFLRALCLQFSAVSQFPASYFVSVLLFLLLSLPSKVNGAAADDQSGSRVVWDIRDYAKTAAVTTLLAVLLIGLMRVIARVAQGINHQPQGPPAPGNAFDIMEGLEKSVIPTKSNKVYEILPKNF